MLVKNREKRGFGVKVHVAIAGLARSLDVCLETVEEKIVRPLHATPGLKVSSSLTLSYSHLPLHNARTAEAEAPALTKMALEFPKSSFYRLEQIRRDISPLYFRARKSGEWLEGSGRNLRNYLEFLSLLNRARGSVVNEGADVVIFLRPDVFVLDRFIPIPGLTLSQKAVLTPRWGKFYGLNDRMAVIPGQFVDQYFSRVTSVEEFIEKNGPLDPEKHLAWSLREVPSRSSLSTELVRVRAGGVLAEKDLERLETSGPYRRAQARKLRQTYPAR